MNNWQHRAIGTGLAATAARYSMLVAALGMVASCTTPAPPSPSGELPRIEIPYERHVLPNGLRLIVHEDHKAPIVSVSAWYHVGGRDEVPGKAGFAHLFEHINFPPGNEEKMSAVGGSGFNASTRLDYTNYYQTVPASALGVALWAESVRMIPMSDEQQARRLEVERAIVKGEKTFMASRAPNFEEESEILWRNTYPADHPYSRTSLGSTADLDAATLADVKEWYATYQGAANAVLVVAGDVRAAEVKKEVEKYFADIPPGPALPRLGTWVAKMHGERLVTTTGAGIPSARLHKVWNIPAYASRDFALLELAAQVLGEGRNSRLHQRLVVVDRRATEVSVKASGGELGSQFRVKLTLAADADAAGAEQALNEEMERFLRDGPTADELERAITGSYARAAQAVERVDSSAGKSYYLAMGELLGGTPGLYTQALDWKRAATVVDVQATAKQWLADGAFVLAVRPQPAYRKGEPTVDRREPPPVAPPAAWALPALQRATLSNGLKVVLLERHDAPLLKMSVHLDAGHAADGEGKAGVAQLAMQLRKESTAAQTAQQIADRAERLGTALGVRTSLDASALSLGAISGRVPESLALLSEVLLNTDVDAAALEKLKRERIDAFRVRRTQPSPLALRTLSRAIYAGHPAYVNLLAEDLDEAALKAVTPADVQAFNHRWVRPDNSTMLIVGDTTLDRIVPLLEQHLGAWKAPEAALPHAPAAKFDPAGKSRIYLVDSSGAKQTEIAVGRATVSRSDPGHEALELVNTILGHRLTLALRETKNLTYDVSSDLLPARQSGALVMRTVVGGDRTVEAVREMRQTLLGMTGPLAPIEAELERTRRNRVLALPAENETTDELLATVGEVLDFKLPDDYWNRYASHLDAVTTAQLQASAREFLQPDGLAWVLVGDLAKIEAGVRALDAGEVIVLDADGTRLR